MIKVGDIIDGKIVTKVFMLSGGLAYQSEPVGEREKEPVKTVLPLKATLEKMGVNNEEEKKVESPRGEEEGKRSDNDSLHDLAGSKACDITENVCLKGADHTGRFFK